MYTVHIIYVFLYIAKSRCGKCALSAVPNVRLHIYIYMWPMQSSPPFCTTSTARTHSYIFRTSHVAIFFFSIHIVHKIAYKQNCKPVRRRAAAADKITKCFFFHSFSIWCKINKYKWNSIWTRAPHVCVWPFDARAMVRVWPPN